ncbi:ABC transporter ATP-binding protein [Clostridium hydrogenum]|uniref:ABC transporter ATP-binding protein n=1 Tax=Clostridium hydrogenum TaxID=2855764 RepID=UPI001F490868|nr:ABC transporter ATP-binding protein [Clostridium hydrogenum]
MAKEEYKIGNHKRTQNSGMAMRGMGGALQASGQKANTKQAFSKLFSYCGKYKKIIIIAVILSISGSILNLVGPNQLSKITNMITKGLISGIDLKGVSKIAMALSGIYVLGFLFNYIQGFIMATVTQRVSQNMRKDISKKINKLPLRYFDGTSTGDVLSRVTNDVDTLGQAMNQSISTLVASVTMFLGSIIMMLYTNWLMAIAGIVSSLLGFIFMIKIISRSQKYFAMQQRELGAIDGHIEEVYAGHSVVKVYNGEKSARKEFHEMNDKLYECAWKSQFMSGLMMPLMIFIGNFAYVVVCIVGAVLAQKGIITFGTIVAFMLYIRLFTQPLQNLSQAAASVQSMAAALERVFEFLDEKELENENSNIKKLSNAKGNVEFKNVHFGYNEDRTIINDFSASVKAGEKVAIVGPTGAGKTTMVNLLMRFYEINKGEISIDGISTSQMTRENIHDLFGMVLQDTWLFEGTIRENIVYSKTNVTDDELDEVCKATGIYNFIHSLPDGYDTILNDKVNLSAGQKQLITIARAMIEDAPLLILDEATSSVDTRTEVKIQEAMDKLTNGRTSFVIAHRLSTIKNADLILVMKDGDIIESGNHKELIAKNGFYANLYNSQFEAA